MYDFGELRGATDSLWAALARHLRAAGLADVPAHLWRPADPWRAWRSPHLLLGQSCGYPLVTRLRGRVRVIATPRYTAPGCAGAWHRSLIIVHRDNPARSLAELRGRAGAVNGRDSNTGMNLLRASIAPVAAGQHFFRAVTVTGGHAASLAAVAGGAADIAAIDCVTYALLARLRPETVAAVRVLTETPASPTLPLIASSELPEASVPVLRAGLMALERDPDAAEARRALLIDGFEVLDEAAYDAVKALEMGAISLGYPTLA